MNQSTKITVPLDDLTSQDKDEAYDKADDRIAVSQSYRSNDTNYLQGVKGDAYSS
jgi:hypothetical protein